LKVHRILTAAAVWMGSYSCQGKFC